MFMLEAVMIHREACLLAFERYLCLVARLTPL